ncbi:MAG: FIST N-terminal domain-containing protein [Gemmatimonadaceae bacterium]
MGRSAVVYSSLRDAAAGREMGDQIRRALGNESPDAVILFSAPDNRLQTLVDALNAACDPAEMVGCSSAGGFAAGIAGPGLSCAIAFRSPEMRFSSAVGMGVGDDPVHAATEFLSAFKGEDLPEFRYRSALVLTDALAGFADRLVDELTVQTGGTYQFFGGGAGDNARFLRTEVFAGNNVLSNAAVGLEILSHKPLGLGVEHGWLPATLPMRVTEAAGMRVTSLDGAPAIEAYESHAAASGQTFNRADPLPFFLHNVLGIQTSHGFKLRVPLSIGEDGSLLFAAEVPEGLTASIMRATVASAVEAAGTATKSALAQLGENKPQVALFFDCVATRLRMGDDFNLELGALQTELGSAAYAGCNTHGQIARSDDQFSGFHNCTAVVCVFPE